jgi:hypothetical protein
MTDKKAESDLGKPDQIRRAPRIPELHRHASGVAIDLFFLPGLRVEH